METVVLRKDIFRKYAFLLFLLISKGLLDLIYCFYISPIFAYMGLIKNVSVDKVIESCILLTALFICTPDMEYKVTHFFLHIQLVVIILPMLSFYSMTDQNRQYMYAVCICHLLQCLMIKCYFTKSSISFPKIPYKLMCKLLVAFILIVILYCLIIYGVPDLTALDFNTVYEIRASVIWRFPLNYFVPWCVKVFIPMGLIIALNNKKYFLFLIIQICLLVFYLLFAHKTFFFIIFFALGIYIVCYYKKLYEALYLVIPAVSVVGVGIYVAIGNIMPLSYLVRRVFILPAQLKFIYYEFFSQNPKYYFSDGQIGRLFGIKSDYKTDIPKTIGIYMKSGASANTGYLGEGYAQAGFWGMILFSITIVIFLKIMEMCSHRAQNIVTISAASYWLYNLNDSALLTSLLTGGGIFLLLLVAFGYKAADEVQLE